MTTISAVDDPLTYLQPPVGSGTGTSIWQLRLKCGMLFGVADTAVNAVMGWSPLERWVFEPFAGDWDAFDRAGSAWRNAGTSIGAVSSNIGALPGQVGDSWNGQAMDAWADLQTKITGAIGSLPEACEAMGEFAEALADMARAIIDLVAEILGIIGDAVLQAIILAFTPVVGPALAAARMTIVAGRVVRFHSVIIVSVKTFHSTAEKVGKIIKIIEQALAMLDTVHTALEAAGSAVSTANRATAATAKIA